MPVKNFGTFPNVPARYRLGAALKDDNTWCVWDYKLGCEVQTATALCDGDERCCRAIAESGNRAFSDQSFGSRMFSDPQ